MFSLGAIDCVGLRVLVDKFDEIVNNWCSLDLVSGKCDVLAGLLMEVVRVG